MKNSFEIIDEQPNFIIINKPEESDFHDEGNKGEGLFNQVKNTLQSVDKNSELYPVHRLDKMTSGLLIFAKNLQTAQTFQTLFEQHKIQKYYLALSNKKPKKKQGLIKGDMAKSRRSAWKLLRSQKNPAITQFISYGLGDGLRLYVVKPHSGKTHQIRVALSSIGAPILGDNLYSSSASNSSHTSNLETDRGYLHAYALKFSLAGQNYSYINPPNSGQFFLSTAFTNQLTSIDLPWDIKWPKVT